MFRCNMKTVFPDKTWMFQFFTLFHSTRQIHHNVLQRVFSKRTENKIKTLKIKALVEWEQIFILSFALIPLRLNSEKLFLISLWRNFFHSTKTLSSVEMKELNHKHVSAPEITNLHRNQKIVHKKNEEI